MIGKGKSISHTKASISYGWNNEKNAALILKQNVAGNSPSEITNEFKLIQSQNEKCKRNTFSFVLSPSINDGQKLTNKHLAKISKDFINDLNLQEHQAVAFVHNDKDHKHVHLYVNRIDFKGYAFKDNYIGKRSQKAAERVALVNGIRTVQQVKEQKLNINKSIRKEIFEKHNNILKSGAKDIDDYIIKMRIDGIKIKPIINKEKNLQGFRYEFKEENLKASEVHRSMSLNNFLIDLKLNNSSFNLRGLKLNNQKVNLAQRTKDYIIENLNKTHNGKSRSIDRTVNRRIK